MAVISREGMASRRLPGWLGRVVLTDHVGVAAAVDRLIPLIEPGEPGLRRVPGLARVPGRAGVGLLPRVGLLKRVAGLPGVTLARVTLARVGLRRIARLARVCVLSGIPLPGIPGGSRAGRLPGIAVLRGIACWGLVARLAGEAARVARPALGNPAALRNLAVPGSRPAGRSRPELRPRRRGRRHRRRRYTRRGRTGPQDTGRHRTGQHRTGRHRTGRHAGWRTERHTGRPPAGQRPAGPRSGWRPAPHRTGQHRTGQHRTGQHRTGQHRTGQHRTGRQ